MDGYWKVYFEFNNKDYKQFIDRISQDTSISIWYEHPNGKRGKGPHIHGLIKDYKKSDDTFRNYLKKEFNIKGSQLGVSNTFAKGVKMSELTVAGYLSYMSKGKYDPVFNKGYDHAFIDKCKSEWVDNDKTNLVQEVTIITKTKERLTEFDLQMEAEDLLWGDNEHDKSVSKSEIYDAVVNILRKHKRLAHYRRVANLCQAIFARSHPVECKSTVLKMF